MKYNIWLYIEEADEEEGTYEDIGEPEKYGSFDTLAEALAALNQLARDANGFYN